MSEEERIWAWEYKGNSPWGPLKPNLDVVKNGAEYVRIDLFENLEAKLSKALTALGEVQRFVKDLEPYADQGHTLVPALQKACAVYTELKGGKDGC